MPNLYVTMTVDWEGQTLEQGNLDAMRQFRKKFPDIPITHFICPAYFTRVSTLKAVEALAAEINSVINEKIDEVALHIHCWYSFMDAAINQHIITPTWNPGNDPGEGVPYDPPGNDEDYGHDVPFGCYTPAEIASALATGIQLLGKSIKHTGTIESFRCGGWLAGDKVLRALQQVGLKYEASATPGKFFREVIVRAAPADPIYGWVADMWSTNVVTAPDYLVNTLRQAAYPGGITGLYPDLLTTPISQPAQMNKLIQIPDTAVLADYITPALLTTHINAAAAASATQNSFISMGWHDVNANALSYFCPSKKNIEIIEDAIPLIRTNAGIFLTVKDAVKYRLALQKLQAEEVQPIIKEEAEIQAVLPSIAPTGLSTLAT